MRFIKKIILSVLFCGALHGTDPFEQEARAFGRYLKAGKKDDFAKTPDDFLERFQAFSQVCKAHFKDIPNAGTAHHRGWFHLATVYKKLAFKQMKVADPQSIPYFTAELQDAYMNNRASFQWFQEWALSLIIAMDKRQNRVNWFKTILHIYLTELCHKAGADTGPVVPSKISEVLSWLGDPLTRLFGTPAGIASFFPHVIPIPTPWYNLTLDQILLTLVTPHQPLWLTGWNCTATPFVTADDVQMHRLYFAFHDWFHLSLHLNGVSTINVMPNMSLDGLFPEIKTYFDKKMTCVFNQLCSFKERLHKGEVSFAEKFNIFCAFHEQGWSNEYVWHKMETKVFLHQEIEKELQNPHFYLPLLPTDWQSLSGDQIKQRLNDDPQTRTHWLTPEVSELRQARFLDTYNAGYAGVQPFDLFGDETPKLFLELEKVRNLTGQKIPVYWACGRRQDRRVIFNPFSGDILCTLTRSSDNPPSLFSDYLGAPPEFIKFFLRADHYHGNVNARNAIGQTVLMKALSFGRFDVVQRLIKEGADWRAQDDRGATAFFYACNHPDDAFRMDALSVLLDAVPDYDEEKGADAIWESGYHKTSRVFLDYYLSRQLIPLLETSDDRAAPEALVMKLFKKIEMRVFLHEKFIEFFLEPTRHSILSHKCWAVMNVSSAYWNRLDLLKKIWGILENHQDSAKVKRLCFMARSGNDKGLFSSLQWSIYNNNQKMFAWLWKKGARNSFEELRKCIPHEDAHISKDLDSFLLDYFPGE